MLHNCKINSTAPIICYDTYYFTLCYMCTIYIALSALRVIFGWHRFGWHWWIFFSLTLLPKKWNIWRPLKIIYQKWPTLGKFFFFFFVVSPITAISFGRNGLFFLTSGRFVQNHHFLSFFVQKKQPVTAKWNGRNGENDKTKTKKLSQSGSFWYIIFKGGQMFHFCWH